MVCWFIFKYYKLSDWQKFCEISRFVVSNRLFDLVSMMLIDQFLKIKSRLQIVIVFNLSKYVVEIHTL